MAVADDTGAIREMEREAGVVVPPRRPEPSEGDERSGPRFTAGSLARLVVFGALAAFLLYYVGPRDMAETAIKVLFAVAMTAAVWIGANLLFDQAYNSWARFNALLGVAIGFVGFFLLQANGLLRTLIERRVRIAGQGVFDDITGWRTQPFDVNGPLWGLIGGAALGLVMLVLSAPRQQVARLPLAVGGFVAFGVLTALAFEETARPQIDWATVAICVAVGAAVIGALGVWRYGAAKAPRSALTGAGLGWIVGAWGGADIGEGDLVGVALATVVPAAIFGVRFGLVGEPDAQRRRRIDQRSRSWIFVVPALGFILVGLLGPLLRTIYLSFRNRSGRETVGWENYREIFTNKNSVNFDDWTNIFTSRLFWMALALVGLGVLAGVIAGRRTRQSFERGPGSLGVMLVGFFLLACAILASIRGTIFNNLWWVIVVTTLATVLGLAVAVLADRAKGENAAKSLIFLPMAISFIGAGIIWRFMYQAREESQEQTGVMNALWVWIGQSTDSSSGKAVWLVVLGVLALCFALLVKRGVDTRATSMTGFAAGFLVVTAYLVYRVLGPGLGGVTAGGVPRPVLFLQEGPFNNIWLMVVLIWIQTGFAMVIFSAAIKAVPTELTEAAKVDGATESQVFWRITLPQIAPTVGVVTTSLFVTVMKVFDLVYAMTNGNFGTQVIANEMWIRAFGQTNLGLGSALAVVLFVSVIPVMWLNIRRMQRERVS